MKYTYLQETTTDWKTHFKVPNHTYIMLGSKCAGYIKEGTTEEIMFSKAGFFSKTGRKFKEIKNKA